MQFADVLKCRVIAYNVIAFVCISHRIAGLFKCIEHRVLSARDGIVLRIRGAKQDKILFRVCNIHLFIYFCEKEQ